MIARTTDLVRSKFEVLASSYRRGGLPEVGRRVARGVRGRASGRLGELVRWSHEYRTDRRYGIRTRGRDRSHRDPDRRILGYQASPRGEFLRLMGRLGVDTAEFTFVDVGCGKGAVVVMAAEAGFRRVVGIELIAEFLASARDNVASYQRRRRSPRADIDLVLGDAARFPLPADPLVLYLFNPFGEPVLADFVRHVSESLRDHPRPVYLVYLNPELEHVVARSSCLELYAEGPGWVIYRGSSPQRAQRLADQV